MIKLEHTDVYGWEAAIRGMRNPMNSWGKSDSYYDEIPNGNYILGENDLGLCKRLCKAGSDHRKFMRQIFVSVDITAPLYWWSEFDTYKVGTVANSCSKMHKIHSKPIEMSDFSFEKFHYDDEKELWFEDILERVVMDCEALRRRYLATNDKRYWKGLIQLLPESYNQLRTVTLNYEVLCNMYHARKNHKLDEWHTFCEWVEGLPYSELITGVE